MHAQIKEDYFLLLHDYKGLADFCFIIIKWIFWFWKYPQLCCQEHFGRLAE